jgi:hypothetical protein
MSERADTTATRVHDALTDLAASMSDHVLPFERVQKAVRRQHRRRRVARTGTAVVVVAAAAVGGLILSRAPAHEGGIPPLSAPSASELPPCRALAAAAAARAPVKTSAPPTDAASAAVEDSEARLAAERAKAAAVAAATGAPGSAAPSPSTDHLKGIGVIVGRPTADSVTVAVHDGVAAGVTLSLTLSPATQYLADDRPCTPEPLTPGQEVGFAATYSPDGSLALDYVVIS